MICTSTILEQNEDAPSSALILRHLFYFSGALLIYFSKTHTRRCVKNNGKKHSDDKKNFAQRIQLQKHLKNIPKFIITFRKMVTFQMSKQRAPSRFSPISFFEHLQYVCKYIRRLLPKLHIDIQWQKTKSTLKSAKKIPWISGHVEACDDDAKRTHERGSLIKSGNSSLYSKIAFIDVSPVLPPAQCRRLNSWKYRSSLQNFLIYNLTSQM